MSGSRKFAANPRKAAERRRRYCELRRDGMNQWDAAVAVGIDPVKSGPRYELWFKVAEAERAAASP